MTQLKRLHPSFVELLVILAGALLMAEAFIWRDTTKGLVFIVTGAALVLAASAHEDHRHHKATERGTQ